MQDLMDFKEKLYGQFARIGKALSSPKRLELLELLCQAPRSVEVIAAESGLSIANTSRHLQVLRAAGLVDSQKQGLFVTYRVADPVVPTFMRNMRQLADKRLAEVPRLMHRYLAEHPGPEPIHAEELARRIESGAVTLIDVRPREEYAEAHLPGAISIPLRELQRHLTQLPKQKTVVAYCRGGYCILALSAVEALRKAGFDALRIEEGIAEWREKGLPVESTKRPPRAQSS